MFKSHLRFASPVDIHLVYQHHLPFQIKTIRDNVEYYVASSRDPDFDYDDECIYDDLDLDELGHSIGGTLLATSPQDEDHFANMSSTPTSTNSSSPSPSPNVANHSKVEIVSIRLPCMSTIVVRDV